MSGRLWLRSPFARVRGRGERGVPPERGHSTDREHRAGLSGRGVWRRAGAAILCAVMAGTPFLAGAAALPITPLPEHLEESLYLGGYDGYLGRPPGGVHDDPFARAL